MAHASVGVSPAENPLAPVAPQARIETLDILRGFALFGVLLINMRNFDLPGRWTGTPDEIALWLTYALADGKFWRLFSFLFGLGFAIQLERAQGRGTPFLRVYVRRAGGLLIVGALHSIFIYDGDILFDYALAGFLLLLFYRCSSRTILLVAGACFLIPIVQFAADLRGRELARQNPPAPEVASRQAAQRQAERAVWVRRVTRGSYGEHVAHWGGHFFRGLGSLDSYLDILGDPFPLFLLGLYVGRRRIFHDLHSHLPLIRNALRWGLALGLLGTFVSLAGQWPIPRWPLSQISRNHHGLFWFIGAPALSLFYTAALVLLLQNESWKKRLAPLGAIGRMALTNYLVQSVIFTSMFLGWGMGLYGQIGPALNILVTLLIYSFNIALSVWWLERFRFGPAEWLWRSLTYGQWQPMRLEVAPSRAGAA